MEVLIGYLLLVGIIASSVMLISGMLWDKLATGQVRLEYLISGMNFFQFLFSDMHALLTGSHFGPHLLVNFGIALLLLTPYIRVLASVAFFAVVERNAKYALFTLFVATVLTFSLFLR
jgi:uncharacterized membrane protein